MEAVGQLLLDGGSAVMAFLAWLGIHPSLQDLVKALILVVFVLAILMIVGDVYRGEIQNQFHRVLLVVTPKSAGERGEPDVERLKRRAHREKDITCHAPQTVVPLTVDGVHSNVLFHFRYRDCRGKLRTKHIETYRSRFHVRRVAIAKSLSAEREADHRYTPEEEDVLSSEVHTSTVSMAGSRVDYLYHGKIEPLLERERQIYEELRQSGVKRTLMGVSAQQICEPQAVGLVAKFHFPIDPHFLLYKHPDTNVRTTAWLTVLTSVFALFMQLIYSGGDGGAASREMADRATLTSHVSGDPR